MDNDFIATINIKELVAFLDVYEASIIFRLAWISAC